ncbi:MAG TPA: M48 family metalloprotease [Candidatus Angelobacter sp.]|nr:M48 family metalloprotease [Candidatus Angelobacter sp.]
MKQRKFLASILAMVLACGLAVAAQQPQLPDPGSAGMTREQQEQVGLQAMAEVYKQMPVLPDSHPLNQYVQRLGRRLVTVIPSDYSWPYQFHVIQQKEINAFAIPGGPIFINVGTIQAADNEAELAGVIAHEMSHVYMQHSAKQAGKASLAQGILGVLGAVLPGNAAGNIARVGIQFGAGTIFMRYSRKDEAQADAVGAIIMYKAGYNPKALAEFFQKLEQQGGGSGPQFLSDHPNPGNRVAAVDKEIQNWPPKSYLSSSQEFARAKQDAGGVRAYTGQQIADGAKQGLWARQNQQNGAVPPNVPQSNNGNGNGGSRSQGRNLSSTSYGQIRPNSNFTPFRHNAFTIKYPSNWQPTGDQSSGVTIAPPAGVAQGEIAYGVIIGGAQDPNASNLDQAMQDLVQNLEQSNPGLQSSGSLQDIQVNGVRGKAVNLRGTSPVQQNGRRLPERDWLIGLPRPQGGLLYLVFIAPENQFGQLSSTYQAMLNSLQLR